MILFLYLLLSCKRRFIWTATFLFCALDFDWWLKCWLKLKNEIFRRTKRPNVWPGFHEQPSKPKIVQCFRGKSWKITHFISSNISTNLFNGQKQYLGLNATKRDMFYSFLLKGDIFLHECLSKHSTFRNMMILIFGLVCFWCPTIKSLIRFFWCYIITLHVILYILPRWFCTWTLKDFYFYTKILNFLKIRII